MNEARPFNPAFLKVLVVSDNAFERRLVMDLLIALGVKDIVIADDAVAAFAQLMLKKPDMVIADAEMKPFSGFMLVKEIRNAPIALKAVPIVLFTSENSPDFAETARTLGVNEVLPKPVSAQAMRRTLEDAALRPRPFVKSRTYKGPDRRRLADAAYRGPERRDGEQLPFKLDPATRGQILAGVDEARACVARWAETGETQQIDLARAAIDRASETAWASGADEVLARALAAAARLMDAAKAGAADPHVLDVSLSAARAVLSAPHARGAMRQALAEAVDEVASLRQAP